MGSFALPKGQAFFAKLCGFGLFVLNFVIIFQDPGDTFDEWWKIALVVIIALLYVGLIIKSIMEPVGPLKKLTQEELKDYDYKKILVEEELLMEGGS